MAKLFGLIALVSFFAAPVLGSAAPLVFFPALFAAGLAFAIRMEREDF